MFYLALWAVACVSATIGFLLAAVFISGHTEDEQELLRHLRGDKQ